MRRSSRNYDWGFPRWREYGAEREAARVRLCDREGCGEPGNCPAPKAPNSPERWWFCEAHAGEYNKNWNYFAGLSAEEAAAREAEEAQGQRAYRKASQSHWQWGGPGDGSRSRAEMDALRTLELESDADEKAVKNAYRRLAKAFHPDVNQGNAEAATKFHAVQAAYEVLQRAAERRAEGR